MSKSPINVGTIAITRGSKVPLINDGVLVVVVAVGHRMNPNRYTIRRVDGQFLGLVSGAFYKHSTALISAARLIPTDETGTDNSLDTGRVPRYAQQPLSSGMPSKAATKAVA